MNNHQVSSKQENHSLLTKRTRKMNLPSKKTSIVIISTLLVAVIGMGTTFNSQNSSLPNVATTETPNMTANQTVKKKNTAPDLLDLAKQSIKKGKLDLAEQYATKFARLNPDRPVEFINLMREICRYRDDNALTRINPNEGNSIRSGFDSRLKDIDKIIDQIDLFLNDHCEVGQISDLIALKHDMNAEKNRMQNKQHEAFETFAENHYNKARNLFNEGKGSHWYRNDDETKFQDALVELMAAFTVIDQLDADTRDQLVKFGTQLKSELNGSEFDAAWQRAGLVNG